MAVSRRLRYEVLRRDNHSCRYCGSMAPDVKLTVDHVVPKALGGSDAADNLVTACQPCNSGKSSTNPDAPLVDDVAQDALRWSQARTAAIAEWRDHRIALKASLSAFVEAWDAWGVGPEDNRRVIPRDPGWEDSCERWLEEGLEVEDLIDLIPKAMHNKPTPRGGTIVPEKRWTYYCGVVWRTLDRLQEDTTQRLATPSSYHEPDLAYLVSIDVDVARNEGFDKGYKAALDWAVGCAEECSGGYRGECVNCGERREFEATGRCLRCWRTSLDPSRVECDVCFRLIKAGDHCNHAVATVQCSSCDYQIDPRAGCASCDGRHDPEFAPILEKFPPADPRWS